LEANDMKTISGIFHSQAEAQRAFDELKNSGFRDEDLTLLAPGTAPQTVTEEIATSDTEQPGMGTAIGGVVGGAVGLAAGSVLAGLVLPGVGSVLALGLGAAGLGLGGAVAGAAGGQALESEMSNGLPKDEMFFYEDALRQGRSVLVASAATDDMADRGREIMEQSGADSVDAAREKWWIGLRETEAEHYGRSEGQGDAEESLYRRGFECALQPRYRGKSLEQANDDLRREYPDGCDSETFRRGFLRGSRYYEQQIQNPSS
jgi:hypothetical protein